MGETMTSDTNPVPAATPGDDPGPGARATRRAFLTTAGAAAAGVGALATGLGAAPAAEAATEPAHRHDEPAAEPASIVAYMHDPANGEITVMSGDREVTVTDHRLTAAFARKVR
jgi:hypothetical protein